MLRLLKFLFSPRFTRADMLLAFLCFYEWPGWPVFVAAVVGVFVLAAIEVYVDAR